MGYKRFYVDANPTEGGQTAHGEHEHNIRDQNGEIVATCFGTAPSQVKPTIAAMLGVNEALVRYESQDDDGNDVYTVG